MHSSPSGAADYYHRYNPDLLSLIPPDAGLVLELGCAAGVLGEQYKRINPHGRYLGLERRADIAAEAARRLDRVHVADGEQVQAADLGLSEGSVDCLVYGDVLEHFVEPWLTLRRQAAWLKEGGLVLACIPNVQHWSVLLNLFRGRWDYQDEGLLDHTHLRFFTQKGIETLFEQAGLKILDMRPRGKKGPAYDRAQRLLEPVAKALGVNLSQFALDTRTVQFIVRAARVRPRRRLLIQTKLVSELICGRSRILEPDRFSATIPGVRTLSVVNSLNLNAPLPEEEKVFIWQRAKLRLPEDLRLQRELLRQGYLVVAEIDDDPRNWPHHAENGYFTFRACHGVQTSTAALADYLRQHNPHVAIFENQLASLPPPRKYEASEKIGLFFGALNREPDWAPIMPALNRILADYDDRAQVKVLHDRRFFDALTTWHKQFEPFVPYERYCEVLRSCEIALLPLEPTPFNLMKSDLKFIECAGHGVVALASPTVYDKTVKDGNTGVLYRSVGEFESKLRELLDNVELRRAISANAYQWVADNRLLCQHYRQRRAWYLQLLDDLPRLNKDLRRRAPELFRRKKKFSVPRSTPAVDRTPLPEAGAQRNELQSLLTSQQPPGLSNGRPDGFHVLYYHHNYPAQFGHVGACLARHKGFRCTFLTERPPGCKDGVERIHYRVRGGATKFTHYWSRNSENAIWRSQAAYDALKARPELKPDLIVGHSGFASTLFFRELYDCPIINYFEYFYRARNSDMDFRPDFPSTEMTRLRARARNAMLLLDLESCDAGYSPIQWQRDLLPAIFHHKVRVIFDGIDTDLWRRTDSSRREVAGRVIPPEMKIVTYATRGMESMRGFDIFMKMAKLISLRRSDVVFVVVGEDRVCYGGDEEFTGKKSFKDWVLAQDEYDMSRFIFPGRIAPTELAALFSISNVHVYLTVPFVLSWSLFNALACGATVLASRTAPVCEVIEHGKNGLLADFFDVERLAEIACEVLDAPEEFSQLGIAGMELIQRRYSMEVCIPQMLELYDEVLSKNSGNNLPYWTARP